MTGSQAHQNMLVNRVSRLQTFPAEIIRSKKRSRRHKIFQASGSAVSARTDNDILQDVLARIKSTGTLCTSTSTSTSSSSSSVLYCNWPSLSQLPIFLIFFGYSCYLLYVHWLASQRRWHCDHHSMLSSQNRLSEWIFSSFSTAHSLTAKNPDYVMAFFIVCCFTICTSAAAAHDSCNADCEHTMTWVVAALAYCLWITPAKMLQCWTGCQSPQIPEKRNVLSSDLVIMPCWNSQRWVWHSHDIWSSYFVYLDGNNPVRAACTPQCFLLSQNQRTQNKKIYAGQQVLFAWVRSDTYDCGCRWRCSNVTSRSIICKRLLRWAREERSSSTAKTIR